MPIQTACASCSAKIKVRDELIGKAIKCPKCGQRLTVDAARGGATEAVSPDPGALPGDSPGMTEQLANAATPDVTCDFGQGAPAADPANSPEADVSGTQALPSAADAAPAGTECLSVPGAGLGAAASSATEALPSTSDAADVVAVRVAHGAGELQTLGGYRIVRELGQGGMGAVYEAEDAKLNRRVALKIMKPEIARHQSHRERFLREARTAAKVKSDFICPIYRVGEDNGVPFIAMPLLKGEPLDVRWRQALRLPLDEVVRIGKEIAQGLSIAHEAGLVHRDIKPANIWLETQRSGPSRAVILDFGLARMQAEDVHITQSGAIIGTPAFMSPEQARGDKHVDARTDLFSLGCVLYALCTGELPFKGDTTMAVLTALATHDPTPPHQISAATPRALSRLIMHLLAKDPDDRTQTAKEVIEQLVAIESDPGQPADGAFTTQLEPPVPPDRPAETGERRSWGAEPTMTGRRPSPPVAAPGTRRQTMTYVLLAALGLGTFGCIAPLAGFGVYYLLFAGGQGPDFPEMAAAKKEPPPPAPTGAVPEGWVVVNQPAANCSVAMPRQPTTQSGNGVRNSTVQLVGGRNLTLIVQLMPPQFGQRGPAGALDQVVLTLLVNSGAVQPGGKVPEATVIALGAWQGRQFRLASRPGITGGYVGIQMDTAPGGARILSVTPDSPAASAGLKADDIVYEAAGRPVPNHQALANAIRSRPAGQQLMLKVKRGEEKLELPVTVGVLAHVDQYVRAYHIGKHLVMLYGPAQGDAPAPETAAFFNSLKLGRGAEDPAAETKLPVHEIGQGLEQRGQLDAQTAERVYRVKLAAGTTYVIDMVSPNQQALDPYLVLTDAAGKQLTEDDDSGGGLNARIVFRPEQSGTYRIVATSFNFGTGAFTLTVRADAAKAKQP